MTRPTDSTSTHRVAVVAATYQNASTLRGVLDGLGRYGVTVIAVDDGSTDVTPQVLDRWNAADPSRRLVIRHDANRGKAAAMRGGFDLAASLGFTHALTIDTDGQHDPADAAALLDASARHPDAIVLGARSTRGCDYPLRSRVGRSVSNVLAWIAGGVRVRDSQCGLRVYPIDAVRRLGTRAGRYAFETEILTRAGWANVAIVEVPVRCIYAVAGGRITHFRPWRDSLSATAMHARLLARSLAPWPAAKLRPMTDADDGGTIVERSIRWLNPRRGWRRLRASAVERDRAAAAVGVGLFVGVQPLFGLKTLLCLALARLLRLPPLVMLGASSLTTPPVGFAAWTASIVVGHALLHGRWPSAEKYDFRSREPSELLAAVAAEWVVGAVACGAIVGTLAWLAARTALRRTSRPRRASPPTPELVAVHRRRA